jgi:APA family basic amino acid/polyamine antiporter
MQAGLIRVLGVGFGLAVVVGSTIGIGILRTPGLVAAQLSSPAAVLAVWVVGGLYTLLGCLCLLELGTALPQAGGYFVYARRAFGRWTGFGVGFSDWLTYCAVLGYVSIAIGEFAALLLAGAPVRVIAIGVLGLLMALQLAGVRISGRFQEITTAVKFLAFLALVAACFAYAARGHAPVAAAAGAAVPAASLAGIIVALQSVVITYGGWQSALYFTEENRDPARELPRSMVGGVAAVIVVYFLVNLALLRVLPLEAMAGSTLPAADAARAIFGSNGGAVITLLSIVSLPPLINAILMIGARILFAMGREGLLFPRAATVNARGTPAAATLATAGVASVLVATGTFQKLVAVASFFLAANYVVSCLALFALRRREPDLARPVRAWGYPWSAGLVLAGAVAFLAGMLWGETRTALLALGLLAAGMLAVALTSLARPAPAPTAHPRP